MTANVFHMPIDSSPHFSAVSTNIYFDKNSLLQLSKPLPLHKLSITNDAAHFLSQCKSTYSFKVKLRLKTFLTPTQCLPIHFFSFLNYCNVFKMTTKSGLLAETVTDFLWHSAALLMRNNPSRVKIMPPSYLGFHD